MTGSEMQNGEIINIDNNSNYNSIALAVDKPSMRPGDEETGNDDVTDVVTTSTAVTDNHKNNNNNNPLASTEHLGKNRQYWRDIILGVNDGIVSTFLLVTGVAGGGLSSKDILLTAIAGALAGAVSMFAGEFVATKSQNEVLHGEIRLEKAHVQQYPSEEMQELGPLLNTPHVQKYTCDEMQQLGPLLNLIGIPADENNSLRQDLMRHYGQNPDALLQVMVALEFGVIEAEQRSPAWAGITSLTSFVVGSLPSVLPFAFAKHAMEGLIAAAALTFMALIAVGVVKTWATRGNCFTAAGENVLIASIGTGIAYGVGFFVDKVVH